MRPRYMRKRKSKKKSKSFTQSKKELNQQIEQHCQQQQKVAKKLTDELNLFNQNANYKHDWKMDRFLKAHPSVLYFQLDALNKKLDKLIKK